MSIIEIISLKFNLFPLLIIRHFEWKNLLLKKNLFEARLIDY